MMVIKLLSTHQSRPSLTGVRGGGTFTLMVSLFLGGIFEHWYILAHASRGFQHIVVQVSVELLSRRKIYLSD